MHDSELSYQCHELYPPGPSAFPIVVYNIGTAHSTIWRPTAKIMTASFRSQFFGSQRAVAVSAIMTATFALFEKRQRFCGQT